MIKDKLKYASFVDFVKKFKKASDIIRMEKPEYIIAPILGAVPFIDILSIIDKHFPLESVHYLPNSSRFANRDELTLKWYSNFYKKNEINEPMKIICLDEVLSGSSAVNGYKQFKRSIEERTKEKAKGVSNELEARKYYRQKLNKNISYRSIGFAEKDYRRNPVFSNLVNKKKVYVLEFDEIPTIDNMALNPVHLKPLKKHENGKITYLPEIESFEVTPEYMNFLQNIATYIGVDPKTVSPINFSRIEEGLKQAKE